MGLGQDTVLFGVPVDAEDTGFATKTEEKTESIPESEPIEIEPTPIVTAEIIEQITETIPTPLATEEEKIESAETPKKRGRPRKEEKIEEETEEQKEIIADVSTDIIEDTTPSETEDKVVPILSVLATSDTEIVDAKPDETGIIPEISEDIPTDDANDMPIMDEMDDDEADLEKLLSAMTPLEEDILEDEPVDYKEEEPIENSLDDSVDATLEKLATEFIENQDKIAAETKSNSRSKIGKLRNILPFKQSKHKDNNGLGDLFGWAGIAANDEDFSVPGFFTSAAAKK